MNLNTECNVIPAHSTIITQCGTSAKVWSGSRVKDKDTGIENDIERVYRVHSLGNETQNPEKIYMDGYERLLGYLFCLF